MGRIHVILPSGPARRWQVTVAERLKKAGHTVSVTRDENARSHHLALDLILTFEAHLLRSRGESLAASVGIAPLDTAADSPSAPPDLAIDLTGSTADRGAPTLRITFDGSPCFATAAQVLATGGLPQLSISIDGKAVSHAAPMVDSRVLVSRGMQDVLARTITAVLCSVDRFFAKSEIATPCEPASTTERQPATGFAIAGSYLGSALPRLAGRAVRRLRYRGHHWRVGYRFVEGPGVAQSLSLDGPAWTTLPDDGQRFFADPFPFEWQGRNFIFLEELPYATGKGVISVAEIDADGQVVDVSRALEEPFHLSYPNVFARDGAIWMIPEGGAAHSLLLYKAEDFPHRWARHCVLVGDQDLFDATLLDHDGRLWLFASQRDNGGSSSDTMVIFHADRLEGPWHPHPMNPVVIDRRAARPGGGFVRIDGRIFLPVQDGTKCYGGGLGLSEITRLDKTSVAMTLPTPIVTSSHWPHPLIHTLNRVGRLETIDGIDDNVSRWPLSPRALIGPGMIPPETPACAIVAALAAMN
ncbi:MAG: hypothetical protein KDJ88_06310 [Bauldia sp.]|nr:hypothetical protein [Bauldia sp.]